MNSFIKTSLIGVMICASLCSAASSKSIIDIDSTRIIRAVSLSELQRQIKNCRQSGDCSREILELGGINEIHGFFIDLQNNDVIIVGQFKQGFPPIYTDDLAIALKNMWYKYAVKKKDTIYYSSPGCSIDPNPELIRKSLRAMGKISGAHSPEKRKKIIEKLASICEQPQKVVVFGIPFHCRFSKVLVSADYEMKRFVNGGDSIYSKLIISLLDMRYAALLKAINEKAELGAYFSQNRFWFCSGGSAYIEEKDFFLIQQNKISLLTENMFNSDKSLSDDSLAAMFASNISNNYRLLEGVNPVYRDMRNLYDLVCISNMLKNLTDHDKNLYQILNFFINEYKEIEVSVDRVLPGLSRCLEYEYVSQENGYEGRSFFILPACGGVEIAINPVKVNSKENWQYTGVLEETKELLISARPHPNALSWDVPIPAQTGRIFFVREF